MKGRKCLKAVIKEVNGKEEVFCSFSLMAFKKMQHCVFENCALDDEIAEWEAEEAMQQEGKMNKPEPTSPILTDGEVGKFAYICFISGSYQGTLQRLEAMGFLILNAQTKKIAEWLRLPCENEAHYQRSTAKKRLRCHCPVCLEELEEEE